MVSSLEISIRQTEYISVCLGCCNKTPHHGWLANRSLFLTVLEAGPSEIKALTDSVPGSFPGGSADKESACSARDPSLIPGSGRPPGEGRGCPLQYSWASLVAQMVKNPPAMQETWVRTLGWEDSLEEGMATHSSILAQRIPMDGRAWRAIVHGVTKSQTGLSD